MRSRNTIKTKLFLALQYILPQHTLSRLVGRLAESQKIWLKNFLIKAAMRHYRINMKTAERKDPYSYPSFNSFFTRTLDQPGPTYFPMPPQLGSPAEGMVSQIGTTAAGQLIQAKGKNYPVEALLAGHAWCSSFQKGSFATIYLAPHNYHRVHIPIDCLLTEIAYVPGKLFSVNLTTADHIDDLFAKNERMIFYCETPRGKLALVMVGALLVAGMKTPFVDWSRSELKHRQNSVFPKPLPLEAGEDIGYFNFGSTVVLVWEEKLEPLTPPNTEVSLGQAIFQ